MQNPWLTDYNTLNVSKEPPGLLNYTAALVYMSLPASLHPSHDPKSHTPNPIPVHPSSPPNLQPPSSIVSMLPLPYHSHL